MSFVCGRLEHYLAYYFYASYFLDLDISMNIIDRSHLEVIQTKSIVTTSKAKSTLQKSRQKFLEYFESLNIKLSGYL